MNGGFRVPIKAIISSSAKKEEQIKILLNNLFVFRTKSKYLLITVQTTICDVNHYYEHYHVIIKRIYSGGPRGMHPPIRNSWIRNSHKYRPAIASPVNDHLSELSLVRRHARHWQVLTRIALTGLYMSQSGGTL
jgi:hypothetical protein